MARGLPLQGILGVLWRWLLPIGLLAAIWWPEWTHYRIDRTGIAPSLVQAGIATPSDAVLAELSDIDLAELQGLALPVLAVAKDLRLGSIDVPGLSGGRVRLQGHPHDHQVGPPTFQLFMAGLSPERLLLQAYQQTNDRQWLELALQRTVQLASHELAQRHDRGFLWNDHAVASRPATLIRLWLDIRGNPQLREAHGAALLSFAVRTGRMLAKSSQFTVRTNHGVMQSLALLQLAAAFPWLPEAPGWRTLAHERLTLQWRFYFSPEGVVLEHSPGYHHLGTVLAYRAQRLYRLNDMPVDTTLQPLALKSQQVLARLMRSDGTLPPIGNTDLGASLRLPSAPGDGSAMPGWSDPPPASQPAGAALYPIAGWGLWWTGQQHPRGSQVMMTWAKHDGHGHKHADEAGLTWWANGNEWLSTVGYWPYGHPLMREAYGWRSSNAPHLPGESARARRKVRLMSSGDTPQLRLIDIERQAERGVVLRRQVVQWDGSSLLVLDFISGSPTGSQTLWTLGPGVRLERRSDDGPWMTSAGTDGSRLAFHVVSTSATQQTILRGSHEPFGGWATIARTPTPVDALQVTTAAAESATVTLFQLEPQILAPSVGALTARMEPDDWMLTLQVHGSPLQIQRRGAEVSLMPSSLPPVVLHLASPGPDVETGLALLAASYRAAVDAYPPWRDIWRFRERVSKYIIALAIGIELGLFGLAAFAAATYRRNVRRLHTALGVLWLSLGYYLINSYLVVRP